MPLLRVASSRPCVCQTDSAYPMHASSRPRETLQVSTQGAFDTNFHVKDLVGCISCLTFFAVAQSRPLSCCCTSERTALALQVMSVLCA